MSLDKNLTEKLQLDIYITDTIGSLNKFKNYSSYCKYVSTHKCIRSFKDMLNYLYLVYNKINSSSNIESIEVSNKNIRMIILLFGFVNFKDDILINNTEYNEELYNISIKISNLFNKILASNNKTFFVFLCLILRELPEFKNIYTKWQKIDKRFNTCNLLLTYHNNEIKKITLGPNDHLINIALKYINDQQIELENTVKYMNDNDELDYFNKYKDSKYTDNIYEDLYWLDVKYRLTKSNPDKLIILDLFEKTKKLLKNCVPNRIDIHKEIDGKIDSTIIKQLLENDIDDEKFLHELIYYILYMLSTFQSKNEDIYTKKWKKKLEDDLRNNVYYKNFIPEFFYTLFHKLKKIIDDKNEFMDFVEGKLP